MLSLEILRIFNTLHARCNVYPAKKPKKIALNAPTGKIEAIKFQIVPAKLVTMIVLILLMIVILAKKDVRNVLTIIIVPYVMLV
jgi:hypothetical protein